MGARKAVEEGHIHLKDYMKVRQAIDCINAEKAEIKDLIELENEWIWGPPGAGKSRRARDENKDLFPKPMSKWWDGYDGQDCVLIDDYDCEALGHLLKIWADHYAFMAEYKGGARRIRPKKIVITSNYSPD